MTEHLVSPESQGLRSRALLGFLEDLEREHLELHAFLLERSGKRVLDCWWAPFGPDKLQRICSAGKALVALAALFAVQEGRFALGDPVSAHLPEALVTPRASRITVYDLLTMHAGHREDGYSAMFAAENPMEGFFSLPFIDEPGTHFFYDNGIPDVLAELVLRKTGEKISDYLRPRLFDPLGIGEVRVEARGRQDDLPTFCLRTEDFLKITKLLWREGEWEGRQLLDPALARAACAWQVPTSDEKSAAEASETLTQPGPGYGFQIWRNDFGGFTLNGGAGQFGLCLPEHGVVAAMHSNEPRSDRTLTLLWRRLRGNLFARPLPEDPEGLAALRAKAASLSIAPSAAAEPQQTFREILSPVSPFCGVRRITLKAGASVALETDLPGAGPLRLKADGAWVPCAVPFRFTEMLDPSEHRKLEHGVRLDTNVGYPTDRGYALARWAGPEKLELWFRSDAWMGSHIVTVDFSGGDAVMLSQENGISYNARSAPADAVSDAVRQCIHADFTPARRGMDYTPCIL